MEDRHAWEQPGAYEAAPDVYRIPLPLPGDHLKAVNVYAIVNGDHLVLIDGGWAMGDAQEALARAVEMIGFGLAEIREFLVTHIHRDHYTQAVALRRAFGTSVSLGEGERVALDAMYRPRGAGHAEEMIVAGAPALAAQVSAWPSERDPNNCEYPDRWIADGTDIALHTRTLRAISTPGHTRGHVVFQDAQSCTLFAGDHVLPHITPSIGLEAARPPSPLRDYLVSLRLLLTLPDARLLPAHGPITESTHARVEELLAHHEQRLTETAKAVEQGASTGFGVAQCLGWTRRQRRLHELDIFNQMMAVEETMAHLEVLVERGWLRRSTEDGVIHFARA
jgi:glyoxylase-like metal-dependent hydrolase (beta-lactamase superfamily II)